MSIQDNKYKHWKLELDEANILWLHMDVAESKVNLLSSAVIDELNAILDDIKKQLPQGVIILSDKKDSFIFGADIKEFTELENQQQAVTFLERGHALMNKLESISCPTVSMIHGMCLGGGTELSLACRYRVMSDENCSRIGLPEIKLGIFPGYGGTVRSIRRAGPLAAMNMMLTGSALPTRVAKKIGLIDEAVPLRQLKHAARHFVMDAPKLKQPGLVQRVANYRILRPLVAAQMRKQVARKAKQQHYPAPYRLIELWKNYASNPEQMLQQEIKEVSKLAINETARNLVRVFFLQEALKKQGKQVEYKARHVHVIGGGIMGGDIASWCAIQGYTVSVQDQSPERLAQTTKRAQTSFKKKYKKDRRAITAASDRLIMDHKGIGVAQADLVIEAIFENAEVKRELYQNIEPRMKEGAILATNTSSIKLEDLSSCLKNPGRLVGLHFFNPVALMPLVEIIHGNNTDPNVLQQASSFARNIGKLPLPVKSSPGFLVNRILMPYLLEAVIMVDEGIAPESIDKAATDFGMPMGPIELADTVGLDICKNVASILSKTMNMELPKNLEQIVKIGHLGKKTGSGFYQYKNGKVQKNKKVQHKNIQEIQDRMIMKLLNESVACLREGIVENADMIDAGVIFGTGFAPFRSGSIHHIHDQGIEKLVNKMIQLEKRFGERFKPDEYWQKLKV
ncbi:MAG: 3-hydroxyacyl-CoA dehydrogenase NAD-binding domain-containing protein [Gammaproteobacteria bacterium]|nr:3-hydroxyacyl-CoA dehydrogenase NAD-binding domain-containing protein [Gammaproteobacteria bacterium]